jgi:hypothetical protein
MMMKMMLTEVKTGVWTKSKRGVPDRLGDIGGFGALGLKIVSGVVFYHIWYHQRARIMTKRLYKYMKSCLITIYILAKFKF